MPELASQKFTWSIEAPAPFESSWMIFVKIMALNYLKPPAIWDVITNNPSDNIKDKKLLLHDSAWVDFERFSAAVGVTPNRLRKGFLDQLGFSDKYTDISSGVRFCPECLAKGYHCSFFNLSLIDACPWHRKKLLAACKECLIAMKFGLQRTIDESSDPELAHSAGNLIYKSKCGHVRFQPHLSSLQNGLSLEEESGINVACSALLQWWYTLSASQHPYACFARKIFTWWGMNDEALKQCLEVAHKIAGPCPWPLRITPIPVDYCEWTQRVDQPLMLNPEEKQTYYRTLYKSVRRQIFRRCLRKHRDCISHLISLPNDEQHYLISSTVCPLALAYICWRIHMERVISLSRLRERKRPVFDIQSGLRHRVRAGYEMTESPRSLTQLWQIKFFVMLSWIEELIDKKSFDIYQWDVELYDEPRLDTYDFEPDSKVGRTFTGRWKVLYPNAEFLIKRGGQRCAGKLERACITPEMTKVGALSLLNYRPDRKVLFRVLNLTEQRRNFTESYAYMEHHYW